MRFCLLLFLSYAISLEVHAQGKDNESKLSGKVIDSITRQPVEYATVALYKPGETKAVNGATTGKDGTFLIEGLAGGTYLIQVESIGYEKMTRNKVEIGIKRLTTIPDILLSRKTTALQNVTVTAGARLVENKIDKLVFNAEKDLTSQTGVATDVLKKVPQVSVDIDGNVELAGSTSIRFLIDGKPSTMYGSSITDVLQAIPASQIKSIEVITNPGAKYDAQGLGGIINIILKKSTAQGINGSLSLTAGTRNENGSFNFNARQGKFGFNAFVSGNMWPSARTLISTRRISSDSAAQVLFNQDGSSQFRRQGYQAGLGFDWTPNEKNDITARINLDGFGNKSNGTIQQSQLTADKTNPSNIYSSIATSNYTRNKFGNHENGAELNYKKHFAREDQELEIGVTTSFGPMHISSGSNQLLQPMDSLIYGTSGTNKGNERQTEITLDYSQPFSDDIKLNVGGKLIFYGISSNSDVLRLQTGSNTYALDTSLSNSLDYKQRVYAMYAELNFPVFQLFSAKLGTRYERTNNHAFFSNAGQPVNTPGYDTWVPSIFVMRKLSEKQTLKLSYSKRIERPDYTDLNPFVNTSDPKNISAGNPNLKPEINNRYELGYNLDLGKGGSFVVTVFYRENHNDIQPFIVYYPLYKIGDSTYTNVSVTTRRNIGLEKNMGLSLFGDLRLATKFSLRSNLFAFYRHTFNAIDKGYNSRSVNYRFNVNASYQFSNSFAGEFFGNFSSARHEAQGKYPSFTSYSFAVRKQFWNNKGSLALTAVNPFNLYVRQETNLFGPGFNLISTRRIPFRSFGINFTWKFGKLVFKKDEEGNKDNNNLNAPAEN